LKITRFLRQRAQVMCGALVLALIVSACTGVPTEITWGHLSLVGSPQNILFAFSDRLVLVDPATGTPVELRDENGNVRVDDEGNARVWQVTGASGTQVQFYTTPVLLDEDTLLATAYNKKLYEIDLPAARINNPEGQTLAGHVVANVLATDEYLYVPLSEGGMEALSRPSLTQSWKLTTEQGVWAQPLLVENTLYVVSLDHNVYALDPGSGEVRWKLDLGGAIASTPVYSDGFLYVGSFARRIHKISTSGEVVAEYDTHDWVWGSPSLVDGVLYAADLGGYVYALQDSGTSFTPVWEPRKVAAGAIRATPLIAEGAIIVGSRDHNTYWVSRDTGEELFHREMVGEVLSDPVLLEPSETLDIPEPMVIISTMSREELLVAFSVSDGRRLWRYGR
jgi:hypothetical protein